MTDRTNIVKKTAIPAPKKTASSKKTESETAKQCDQVHRVATSRATKEPSKLLVEAAELGSVPPKFTFEGRKEFVWCTSVYDGDTITVALNIGDKVSRVNCRMIGYNSAEIRGKTVEEKEAAKAAKARLEALILNKFVWAEFGKSDKYGRPLIDVYVGEKTICEIAVSGGWGKPYDGEGEKNW
jgi:endonuclease YncB( thermonuclease family)